MNSILLYINPKEAERQQMIQMAADLVEALTFQFEGPHFTPQSISIIADPSACLEIGLSMLGRGKTRTLEGGERRTSPLTLYPFISGLSREYGEFNLIRPEEPESGDFFGMLDDLIAFGAIERDPEFLWEGQFTPNSTEILESILQRQSWQSIVIFAPDYELEQIQSLMQIKARIVNARHLNISQERIYPLLEQLEPIEDEETHNIQQAAVISALQLEALLSRLESID